MCSAAVTESSDLNVGSNSVEMEKHGSDLFKPQVKLVYGFLDGWDSE